MGWFSRPSVLRVDDKGVAYGRRRADWKDLASIKVRTTSAGPGRDDVFFVLGGPSEIVIPQSADRDGGLFARLQQFPGFDNSAFIASMGSVDNAEFLCWVRR